jgi:hypothetical protein
MKAFPFTVILLAITSRYLAAEPVGPVLKADERKEARALIAAIVAAGFPDGKGAAVYAGKVAVSATFDPGQSPPPLPSSASTMQMSIPNSTRVTYGYSFDGTHFKLADGSWILALSYHFKPQTGDAVTPEEATEVKLATLTADTSAAHPFDAEKSAAEWLEKVAPAQLERSKGAMNRLVPVLQRLKLGADDLAPAIVLLDRAGYEDAAELSFAIADQRARKYWQLHPWEAPDMPFDPTGHYADFQRQEETWRSAQAHFVAEAPPVAMRRAIYRWCRSQLMIVDREDAMLPVAVAAAAAKAAVDPADPQKNAARIDALAAGAILPVSPQAQADLAARLASWEARPREPRMSVRSGGAPAKDGSVSFSTSFAAPVSAYTPDKADLDALVALLADERPSRFSDFSGPRSIGDNAWRACAMLLGDDPRTLAGHPTDRPWTAAERKAAAIAVQEWWKKHGAEHPAKEQGPR